MSKPIILTLSGGLGNQLFQVCAGIYIEQELQRSVIYNVSNLTGRLVSEPGNYTRKLEVLDLIKSNEIITARVPIQMEYVSNLIKRKYLNKFHVYERGAYDNALGRIHKKTKSVNGFFQSADLANLTWNALKLRMSNSEKFSQIFGQKKVNRIAVHVRFGDYSDDPRAKKIFGLTKLNYFDESIKKIFQNLETCDVPILVVSDDISKAQDFFARSGFRKQIDYNSISSSLEDFYELSKSSWLVISNSTFAWWAAFTGHKIHGSRVVYPKPWFARKEDFELPLYNKDWEFNYRTFEV